MTSLQAAIDLGELEADVAAAQDDEMRGEKIDFHHRAIGEIRNLVEAGDPRDRCSPADIDEDAVGADFGTVNSYFLLGDKPGMAFVNRTAF